jgi:hypothetical protein
MSRLQKKGLDMEYDLYPTSTRPTLNPVAGLLLVGPDAIHEKTSCCTSNRPRVKAWIRRRRCGH